MACAALLAGSMTASAQHSKPGSPEEIKVNATCAPEVRQYAAIVAGLDAFDQHRAMAPAVPMLRFRGATCALNAGCRWRSSRKRLRSG